ncbi:MAG: STAS domain-containing protein [Caldilineae bacterium]|nr:MAG: STAS domain-containing protein [Caldilineae bacterium]
MKLTFWGVRGSIPSPLLPQVIGDKILHALREAGERKVDLRDPAALTRFAQNLPLSVNSTIGGNTTCITLESEDILIIFDAGSGMRELGRYLMTREFGMGKGHAHIFFTHTHWDHIQGFPFFVPAFVKGNRFDIYHVHPYVPQVLHDQMKYEVFPAQFDHLASDITFHQIGEGEEITLGNLRIGNIQLQHPGKAYSYRVDGLNASIVLATDGEYKRLDHPSLKRYLDFYREADILIFDAQFSVREAIIKEDWGHSSGLIGADIARAAKVNQLVLFHHDPTSTDEEIMVALQQTREYLAHHDREGKVSVEVAREGWEVTFERGDAFGIEERTVNEVVCLALRGYFDARASETFTRYILDLVQTGNVKKIILDMANLQEMTMAGIRALLDARRNVYSMAIINVPDNVYRVLELAGTTDFFAIYASLDDALKSNSMGHVS